MPSCRCPSDPCVASRNAIRDPACVALRRRCAARRAREGSVGRAPAAMIRIMSGDNRVERPIPWAVIPLFQALKPAERESLRPLVRIKAYEEGEVIFREGDPGAAFH